MRVREIKRTIVPAEIIPEVVKERKRVAAYARVSTDTAEQETSYEAQKSHFTKLILDNPEWDLVDIYADEESGTRTFKRENFMRMIKDCEDGKIDMVLTKSISRFARNTVDCLKYIRKLRALGIPIYFTKEGINTLDGNGEVLVTIMASIAQQESASISQNVQIGMRYHYAAGRVAAGVHRLLGYKRTSEGRLEIIPEEAEIVRRIYREFLDGYTETHIGQRLREAGIRGKQGEHRSWTICTIIYILTNEKYMGDLLLQKYYTVDYLNKVVAKNKGQVPQYYVENAHAPIVPKKIFYEVQAEISRRRKLDYYRYNHKIGLSGRVFCSVCGASYRRMTCANHLHTYWRCASKVDPKYKKGACEGQTVREDVLHAMIVNAFNMLPEERDELIKLRTIVEYGPLNQADAMLIQIQKQIDEYQSKDDLTDEEQGRLTLLQGQWTEVCEKRAEFAIRQRRINDLLDRIDFMLGKAPEECAKSAKCSEVEDFNKRTRRMYPLGKMTEYNDDDVIRFVEKVTIFPEKITVEFKAGVSVDVPMMKVKPGRKPKTRLRYLYGLQ